MELERLPQSNKDLSGLEPCNRVQVPANVYPHRTHRRLIAKAEAYSVTVIPEKPAEANAVVNISAIIEDCAPQSLFEGDWKAPFGIEDEKFMTARGNANLRSTCGGVIFLGTESGYSLGPCSI